MKEVTITEDQLKNMLDKIKELEDYVKLLKAEVAWAERGYTQKAELVRADKREWVGLTEVDIDLYALDIGVTANKAPPWLIKYARDIEAKLKEKNT